MRSPVLMCANRVLPSNSGASYFFSIFCVPPRPRIRIKKGMNFRPSLYQLTLPNLLRCRRIVAGYRRKDRLLEGILGFLFSFRRTAVILGGLAAIKRQAGNHAPDLNTI